MTVGVVWEFYEYGMDTLFPPRYAEGHARHRHQQRGAASDGRNIPVVVTDITKSVIYGTVGGVETEITLNGYLDIGIHDTMKDLLVNFIGAIIMSLLGYVHIKRRGEGPSSHVLKNLMPTIESNRSEPPDGPP